MPSLSPAFIYSAARTPFGRYAGALSGIRPDDLAATVLEGLLAKTPDLDPSRVGEVVYGNANGAGEDNRNVARMAVLLAGLPVSTPATTVNRLCGSSLDAAMIASRLVETGDADVAVAGGVESMSRAPWVLPKPAKPFPAGNETLVSTTLGWRLVNPRMRPEWTVSLGEANEQLQEKFGISRERQDEFALRSHRLADAAWERGFYDDQVIAVPGAGLKRDESIRPETTTEALSKLRPVFREDGTVTAGNASPLNDGAAAALIADEGAAERIGREPLARIASRAAHGVDPDVFGIGPVQAANDALERAGIGWDDLAAVELNEAFASQSLACLRQLSVADDAEHVNPNGGAIAFGHPLGMSGARLAADVAEELTRRGGRYGLATMCVGVGQGVAMALERVS